MRDAAMMRQLKREEKLMACLNHENVTKLFEVFETVTAALLLRPSLLLRGGSSSRCPVA